MSKKCTAALLALVLISFLISLYFYPRLPDEVASHWNARGEVNGYTSRFWGAFSMPVLLLGIAALLILIPKIDPLRKNFR